jgi:hypothetical protein
MPFSAVSFSPKAVCFDERCISVLPQRRLRHVPGGFSMAGAAGSPVRWKGSFASAGAAALSPFPHRSYRCGRCTMDLPESQVKGESRNSQGHPQTFFVVHRTA